MRSLVLIVLHQLEATVTLIPFAFQVCTAWNVSLGVS